MLCLWPNRLDNTFCYYRVINILPPFQIIRRFDFFGTSILLDVPKKSKRLIIWNGGSIFLCIIALWFLIVSVDLPSVEFVNRQWQDIHNAASASESCTRHGSSTAPTCLSESEF